MATANNEFFEALSALEKERGLPEDYLIEKIKTAIVIAVKKDYEVEDDNVMVEIDPATGNPVTHTGKTMNDWLLLTNSAATEDNFDLDTWRSKALHPDSAAGHGYFFKEIEDALHYGLRRESESNPNRFVTELAAIDIHQFANKKD